MRFYCPNCDRDEEILLDRKPWCLVCHIEMIGASDYSKVWMSPYFIISRLQKIKETYGTKRALTDGRFKKEREAVATAFLALALSKLKNEEYYIEIETVENTPDIKLHHIDQSSGHNNIWTHSVEVVDWEEHVPDIMEVIRKKCSRLYPEYYFLLVSARHTGGFINFTNISEELKTIHSPFLETWVTGFSGINKLAVARVAPGLLEFSLDYRDELQNAKRQTEMVKRGNRGTAPGFRSLGPAFLPIP
jgi:hypothetical protein